MRDALEMPPAVQRCVVDVLEKLGIRQGCLGALGFQENIPFADGRYTLYPRRQLSHLAEEGARLAALVLGCEAPPEPELWREASAFCIAGNIPLVVCAPNASYRSGVYELFSGRQSTTGVTEEWLVKQFENAGLHPVAACDWKTEEPAHKGASPLALPGPEARGYLDWVKGMLDPNALTCVFVRAVAAGTFAAPSVLAQKAGEAKPFLTVLVRTQGKRLAELQDVLLCLCAQADDDFEVVLVGHKVMPQDEPGLTALLEAQPPRLAGRIRYLALDTGNRSAPLNYGMQHAHGSYISILDDDDLVTADWVETFRQLYAQKPGAILHAYSVTQDWTRGSLPGALRADSRPSTEYCVPFDAARQFHINKCPTMSLAYPAWLYHDAGIRFDESLDTNEDWDFLMRTAFLAGVADKSKVTSLYRIWGGTGSSHQMYTDTQWEDTMTAIKRKWKALPVLLPPGSSADLEEYYRIAYHAREELPVPHHTALLFSEKGVAKGTPYRAQNLVELPSFHFRFHVSAECAASKTLRFDPLEKGGFSIEGLRVAIYNEDGVEQVVLQDACWCNGQQAHGQFVFIKEDPQIYIPLPPGAAAKQVVVSGCIHAPISPALVDALLPNLHSEAVLFWDDGYGAREETACRTENTAGPNAFHLVYHLPGGHLQTGRLRFDPVEKGGVVVRAFTASFLLPDGTEEVVLPAQCNSNGARLEDGFAFFDDDPQVHIPIPSGFNGLQLVLAGQVASLAGSMPEGKLQGHQSARDTFVCQSANQQAAPAFRYRFRFDVPPTGELAFEPCEYANVYIPQMDVSLVSSAGRRFVLPLKDCASNGYDMGEGKVFLSAPPQVYIPLDCAGDITEVEISGTAVSPLPHWALPGLEAGKTPRAVLYADDGKGFREALSFHAQNKADAPGFLYHYVLYAGVPYSGQLRFDPAEMPGIALEDVQVELKDAEGRVVPVPSGSLSGNYSFADDRMVFLKPDPQLYFPVPAGFALREVILRGTLHTELSPETVDSLTKRSFVSRALSRLLKRRG